ncbi:MAG: beta-propeller fold lactonase family protein, partial [Alphaproteobacteria bacterium]|nr:beta-propeller fold lactonase family protein [Alphaproteobacteria bacterium]
MNTLYAYVGCYTTPERHGRGNGINVYKVDRRSGGFRHLQTLKGLENPSFLAVHPNGRFLYSVHGDRSEATAYAIDPA